MSRAEQELKSFDWCKQFPLRMQIARDAPLFCSERNRVNQENSSMLSPATNLVLNTICTDKKASNFIICYPSTVLKPLILITYILAKQNGSVLVFSSNKTHNKNYYLLKDEYGFAWNRIPAGIVKKDQIHIVPHTPQSARRSFRAELKSKIPNLVSQFFDEERKKIIFYQKPKIKLTGSVKDLYVNNEHVSTGRGERDLGIKNVMFEFLDNYIYNKTKFDIFKDWINVYKENGKRFIFHIANPYYGLLDKLKAHFDAYVLYLPLTFLKSNEGFREKTDYYYKSLRKQDSTMKDTTATLNIDNFDVYAEEIYENISILKRLKKGNIDRYFVEAMNLFKKLDWTSISKDLRIVVYKLKQLLFRIFRMVTFPNEFSVRFFNEESVVSPWRFYPLVQYLRMVSNLIKEKSTEPSTYILKGITSYLTNIMQELSECKRFGETKTFSRKGKNYELCEYLSNHRNEHIIIGVQIGERKALLERLTKLSLTTNVRINTVNNLSKTHKDYPDSTLILTGRLLPNHFPLLFKSWKKVLFIVYKGMENKWVKDQIKLLDHVDISREELSLKYLAEILEDLIVGKNYKLEEDSVFKSFIAKKRKIIETEQKENIDINARDILELDVKTSQNSIIDIVRNLMKKTGSYEETISEEKIKNLVKKYEYDKADRYYEKQERIDFFVSLKNEITEEHLQVNLDINKRYMFFRNKESIKIEFVFPYFLKKEHYIVLFGEEEKLSLTDFVKETYGIEEDIDYDLVEEWPRRLALYNHNNFTSVKQFHTKFCEETKSTISYGEFGNWVRGNINYTRDPEQLYNLGVIMNDEYILQNYLLIHGEGKKIQAFNLTLSKTLKKIVKNVLDGTVSRTECTIEELNFLNYIENSIFKIIDFKK